MRRATILGTFLLCLVSAASARAETVTEAETNSAFETPRNIGGASYVLTGVAAREAAGTINVYGAAMYVETRAASKAWGGYVADRFAKAGLMNGDAPNFQKIGTSAEGRHFMVYGNMGRAIELAFVREVQAEQIQGAYNESWDRVRLDRAAAGDALTQFMAAVNHPMRSGQRMMIRSSGNNIFVTMPGQAETRIAGNRAMTIALWKVYFGDPPLQRQLRDGLMSMLQNVHALFTAGN
jgi:hypothetical protein